MNEQPCRFETLMDEMRNGSESAAREVFDLYGPHILRVIRHRLDSRLRTHFDSLDFQQDVWKSFFTMPAERITFKDPAELAAYLSKMAGNKVAAAFRYAGTKKRDLLRQRSLHTVGENNPAIIRRREATPSQVVVAEELAEQLREKQTEVVRRVVAMRMQGKSYEEIGRAMGLSDKSIQRLMHRLKEDIES